MNKKHIILIIILIIFTFTIIMWIVLKNQKTAINNVQINITDTNKKKDLFGSVANIGTIFISPEKPLSFEGVEMETFQNEFFEITFPKKWRSNEIIRYITEDASFHYSITPDIIYTPGILEGSINPLFYIDVENTDQKFFSPDEMIGEKWFMIRDQKGLFSPGSSGANTYRLLYNNRIYSVHMVTILRYYDISEQEALWVISTFKITK